ncbi:MAG: 6-phosphofructokinase [Planctomycetes bacterium]|nr:6-phosphofructokinase [Planctomycetota bacterium]
MSQAPRASAVVGQSGGPTGVINASLVGIIEEACQHAEFEHLYGAVHAVEGIVNEQFVDLARLSRETLESLATSPSAALGSSRDKPDRAYCENIFQIFQKRNVRYFFYIGGNDSANTAHIINEMAAEVDYDLRAFHVPKTIDNDLEVTDHCPGYGTAALFVANAVVGDDLDNRSLPGIKIDVIMGRDAGFLTAAAALGRQRVDDGPHLIYVPERPVTIDKFVSDVDSVYRKLGRCVVAVSEGIKDGDGVTWAKRLAEDTEVDAHGNVQLSGTGALADFLARQVREKLGVKRVRADTFGYLQRSFAGLQSPTDAAEARACGRRAVTYALEYSSGSVAMKRIGEGREYAVDYFRTDLSRVAEKTKSLPDEFINDQGNNVTEAFMAYALPLTGGLAKTAYLSGNARV